MTQKSGPTETAEQHVRDIRRASRKASSPHCHIDRRLATRLAIR